MVKTTFLFLKRQLSLGRFRLGESLTSNKSERINKQMNQTLFDFYVTVRAGKRTMSTPLMTCVLILALPLADDTQGCQESQPKIANATRKRVRAKIQLAESNEWLQLVREYLDAVQKHQQNCSSGSNECVC